MKRKWANQQAWNAIRYDYGLDELRITTSTAAPALTTFQREHGALDQEKHRLDLLQKQSLHHLKEGR
jgi:hypothetical protein